MDKITTISDVSKALGIPASTLRYWDKQGLLRFERGLIIIVNSHLKRC